MTSVTSPKPPIKEEPKTEEQSFSNPKTDKCGWGPNCPFCKNQEKEEKDWDGNHQKQLQQKTPHQQEIQMPKQGTPGFKLPETPELTEAQSKLISESVKNPPAVGSGDGKT